MKMQTMAWDTHADLQGPQEDKTLPWQSYHNLQEDNRNYAK